MTAAVTRLRPSDGERARDPRMRCAPAPRVAPTSPGQLAVAPTSPGQFAALQRLAGNRAVSGLVAAATGASPPTLSLQRCGDDTACGCAPEAEESVQRDILDDVEGAATSLIDEAGGAVSTAVDAVSSTVSEAAADVSSVVEGDVAAGVVDGAESAASTLTDDVRSAVSDVTGAAATGDAEMKAIRALAPAFSPQQIAALLRLLQRESAGVSPAADVRATTSSPLAPTGQPKRPVACAEMPCPPGEEVSATPDIYQSAERCIQAKYRQTHPVNTVSSNKEYLFLTGRTGRERDALDCLRSDFTAKSGTHPGEPDIWDFTNNTMYEVTTKNGAAFRKGKLAAEIALANKVAGTEECGGQFYDPGTWMPTGPCLSLGLDSGEFMTVTNDSGVLIYTPMRRKRQEQEQEQEQPVTGTDEEEAELKRKLATVALYTGITLAALLVIVLCVAAVLTAPAWVPALLAALGVAAVVALVASVHESSGSGA